MSLLKKYLTYLMLNLLLGGTLLNAQTDEIDKLLDLDVSDLINLEVITASKILQKASEVPATVRVITQDKIVKNGYITLEDVLADLQGFQFRNILGFNSYVFQRGLPNQNNLTLILVDGIQINELNSGGFYAGGQYDLDNVKRIEVVYGPASALYGTNAISGIVNIITKSPKDSQGLEAGFLYGSFNTISANAGYRYFDDENQFGIGISGMLKTSNKADLGGSKGDFNWSENMENFEDDISVYAKVNYKDLTLGIGFQNKKASRTTNYKTLGTEYLDEGSSWNINFLTGYLKHIFDLSDAIHLSSQVYYRDATVLDNTVGYVTEYAQEGYYRPNNLVGIEEILSYSVNSNLSVIGGMVYELENLALGFSRTKSNSSSAAPPAPTKPEQQTNNLFSLYLQSRFNFANYFNLYAGLRYDNSSVYDHVITPRLGLVYNYKKIGAKIIYTNAYRAPKPWDYTNGLGNSDLEPERMTSIELCASYNITKNSLFELSLYRNLLKDKLSQINISKGFYWDNKGESSVEGIEFYSEFAKGNMEVFANYTFNYSVINETTDSPEIARHSANLGLNYNFADNLSVGVRNNYIGERLNPKLIESTGNYKIGAALISHLNISYEKFYDLNFRLFIKNIFNVVYYHSSNRPPDRYRQPQRSVILKLEYNLFTN